MYKYLKKVAMLATATLLIAGCTNNANHKAEYLPVQMSKGDAWSIIDKNGKEVVKEEYPAEASFSPVYEDVYWVKQNGTYQLFSVSSPKQPLTDVEFAKATLFAAGRAAVSTPNVPIRIINTQGSMVVSLPKNIKKCTRFWDSGYAVVTTTDDTRGIIDKAGKMVVEAKYAWISISDDDDLYMAYKKDEKEIGIFSFKKGRQGTINQEKYRLLSGIHEGKILVRDAGEQGSSPVIVLDTTGKRLFEIKKSREDWWSSEQYKDGYFVFKTEDGKYGVVDDEGTVVIRAKYNQVQNMGDGRFAAKKGDKWGVVDAKDETVLDFDYEWVWPSVYGSNFFVKDGSSWAFVDKEGKEQASFDNYSGSAWDYEVDYVDLASIASALKELIEGFEAIQSASGVAKAYGLSIDNYHYSYRANLTSAIGDKIEGKVDISFDDHMAEVKTHQESVNDGWFTTTQTVIDGWQWTNARPTSVKGTLTIKDDAIAVGDLYKSLCSELSKGRKDVGGGKFSKNVKIGGKPTECQTSLTEGYKQISFDITFNQ